MRFLLSAVVMLASASVATAQTPTPTEWAHPAGLYSLTITDFSDLGPEDGGYYIASFVPEGTRGPPQLSCFVQHRPFWTDGTQPDNVMNPLLRRRLPSTAVVTESNIDGVTTFSFEEDGGSFAIHYRVFQLPSERGNDYHEVSCGGSKPISAEQWNALDSILNSLRFRRR